MLFGEAENMVDKFQGFVLIRTLNVDHHHEIPKENGEDVSLGPN